jgi:DNA invertase Pin-like site-specific DNA recombinase
MTAVGYARVSTPDQSLDAQTDLLTAAGCERVFSEKVSGKLATRPEWDKALDYARKGDVLVVTKLDRIGRSVHHLVEVVQYLREHGIGLRVLQQAIDTTTPGGMLVFHVFAAVAEFERELIVERTRDGLAAARARGRKGGRPAKMTASKLAIARQMYDSREHKMADIAAVVGVSRATLYRHLEPAP